MKKENAVVLVNGKNPVDILNGNAKEFIAEMALKVNEQVFDVNTKKGRDDIISQAFIVTKTKTAINAAAVNLTSEWRESTKKVNEDKKEICEGLDALAKKVREPVTVWEKAEEDRVCSLKTALGAIEALVDCEGLPSVEISHRIIVVESVEVTEDTFQEYFLNAENLKKTTLKQLKASFIIADFDEKKEYEDFWFLAIEMNEKFDSDKLAEIARKEQEWKDRKASDERIAKNAKIVAEAKAKEEKEKANEKAKKLRLKNKNLAAENKLALENAEKARLQSIEDAKIAERKKIEDEQKIIDDAQAVKDADTKHRSKVNNSIVSALLVESVEFGSDNPGITEHQAKCIVNAIYKNLIPSVSIKY